MAGPKKPAPPPEPPPPLGAIVVDGANVIASSRFQPIERLDLVEAWCRHWRPDLPVMVFVDYATAMRCQPQAQQVLRARCADVTPGRARYAVCPRGEPADEHVLRHAREHRGLVISNDRFWEHEQERVGTVTVQFRLQGTSFEPSGEATWFRPPNSAVRVALAALRARFDDDTV
ncbi:MAG: hypothetical protein R3F29_14405 [Planctomycetota bacterium]